jgi:hypothetical protein
VNRPWLALCVALPLVLGGVLGYRALRPRPAPDRELYRKLLPAWQAARFRPMSSADSAEARALVQAAQPWPGLAAELVRLDQAWPDEDAVRKAVEATNRAAQGAGLPYYLDVQLVRDRPIVLTYEVAQRTPWRAGANTVELLRVRRLDTLNVELAMLGETQGTMPRVLLDRIEASLARELPLMPPPGAPDPAKATPLGLSSGLKLNDADLAALLRLRTHLEARAPELRDAIAKLRAREELLESMRARFHKGSVRLSRPDGFVLGESWVESMQPYTRLDRPGGPLMLDTDLRSVARADEELRRGAIAEALRRAVDELAAATDVHEVRHALDGLHQPAPPPPLVALFPPGDLRFPGLAGLELRAYLAELHHGALPPCVTAAKLTRTVYGAQARRTPHFFAGYLLLRELTTPRAQAQGQAEPSPVERLTALCSLPEPALHPRAAELWQSLYGEPLVAAAPVRP